MMRVAVVTALGLVAALTPCATAIICYPGTDAGTAADNSVISISFLGTATGFGLQRTGLTVPNHALVNGRCTTIAGNVKIACQDIPLSGIAHDGPITSLDFMSQVSEITGYLWIENCSSLDSLSGLNALRKIGGTPTNGLRIRRNNALTDVKPIEQLETINNGGVEFARNAQLCYIEMMPWRSIVKPSTAGALPRISAVPVYRNCTQLPCNSDCYCGFCGGAGSCPNQDHCRAKWYDPPRWVHESDGHLTGYIILIIVSIVLSMLVVFLVHGCATGKISCSMHWPADTAEPRLKPARTPKKPAKAVRDSGGTKSEPKRAAVEQKREPEPRLSRAHRAQTPESHHSTISLPKLKLKPEPDSDSVDSVPAKLPIPPTPPKRHRPKGSRETRNSKKGAVKSKHKDTESDGSNAESLNPSNADVVAINETMLKEEGGTSGDDERKQDQLTSSFELSRPEAADIAATVLVAAQMRRKMTIKAKDVTLDNAPAAMRELAIQAFAPKQASLGELETTVQEATSEDSVKDAVLKLKVARQKVHAELQQRRKAIREQINSAENPAQKQSAVSSMIVVRLQLELFQRMIEAFKMPPAE